MKTPAREPTEAELQAFFDFQLQAIYRDPAEVICQEDRDQVTGDIEAARVAVFDNYISDGPGYTGSLMVVIWGGGPETFELYGWDLMGQLYRIKSDREARA